MTITGRVPALLLLGVAAVVVVPGAGTVLWWLAAVLALTLLDLVLATPPRVVEVVRGPMSRIRLGERTTTRLEVVNTGRRRVRGVLRDAWQPTAGATGNRHALDLRPQELAVLTTTLLPTRRGDRRTDLVTVRTLGPLRLAARQQSRVVEGRVRVLPPFHSRKHLPSRLARLRDIEGLASVRVRGPGTEFDSLREYVRGDDVRSIDWRASARSRDVVVRTWQPERDRRVLIVLDTSRVSAGRVEDVPRLDSAMETALLLAALAARAGDRVDFLAGDRRVRARVRAGTRGDVLAHLVDAMADLEPVLVEADWSRLASAAHELGRHPSLVVLLTALEPAVIEQSLLPALPGLHHHRVVLASVRDPELERMTSRRATTADVYGAAAAERVLADRREVAGMLNRLGVDVVDADAEQLPVAVTDHYLMLKSRGLL